MGCCNTTVTNIIRGVFPSEDPPAPDMYLFYATVAMSGNATDEIMPGSYGSGDSIPQFSGTGLVTFLQGLTVENAGGGMDVGDTSYSFWIVIPTEFEPEDWLWNGDPIDFEPIGVVTKNCYQAVPVFDDISVWAALSVEWIVPSTTIQGAVPQYNDPAFDAFWQNLAVQIGGIGVVGSSLVVDNTITLTVNNTYLPFQSILSTDGQGNFQPDNFIVCP